MRLKDLETNISDLGDDELMSKVKEIRNRRIEAPERVKAKEKKATKTKEQKIAALLGVSVDDLTSFIGDSSE